MDTLSKIMASALLIAVMGSCKKKEGSGTDENAFPADTVATVTGSDTTEAGGGSSTASGRFEKKKASRELTSAQIDSIKAERDKIVTPPSNVGASGTPGSGRAVPANNKVAPGNNASQGSSTGNVDVKK